MDTNKHEISRGGGVPPCWFVVRFFKTTDGKGWDSGWEENKAVYLSKTVNFTHLHDPVLIPVLSVVNSLLTGVALDGLW